MSLRHVVVEADGGSRGNPGPAAYGALVRDPDTGRVVAQAGVTIGVATNNVAEYSGLIAGLELAAEHAPEASIEVRMDSKLVVEQMAGNWKVKHPDLKPLWSRAQSLAPFGTEWTWVPRAQNAAADALANLALDGKPVPLTPPEVESPVVPPGVEPVDEERLRQIVAGLAGSETPETGAPESGLPGTASTRPTRLVLVAPAASAAVAERFPAADDPGLSDLGRAQATATAELIAGQITSSASAASAGSVVVVSAPAAPARETAAVIADRLGGPGEVEPRDAWADCSFGDWSGLTVAEAEHKWPEVLAAWSASTSVTPPGGESFDSCARRARSARDALLTAYAGRTVVVVTHPTLVRLMVRGVLQAPMASLHRITVEPAAVTTIDWYADGSAVLRGVNQQPGTE